MGYCLFFVFCLAVVVCLVVVVVVAVVVAVVVGFVWLCVCLLFVLCCLSCAVCLLFVLCCLLALFGCAIFWFCLLLLSSSLVTVAIGVCEPKCSYSNQQLQKTVLLPTMTNEKGRFFCKDTYLLVTQHVCS